MTRNELALPAERIEQAILLIRGQKVMLDSDLAELYGVPTKRLTEAVRRNKSRFPSDFMFQLTTSEFENLRTQFATSSWGGRRYSPFVFTEHGILMLSSVLRSERAVQVNIAIMRHSSITLTMDTYGHLFPGQEADAVAKMPGMFGSDPEAQAATGTDGPVFVRGQKRGQSDGKTGQTGATAGESPQAAAGDDSGAKVLPMKALRDTRREAAEAGPQGFEP